MFGHKTKSAHVSIAIEVPIVRAIVRLYSRAEGKRLCVSWLILVHQFGTCCNISTLKVSLLLVDGDVSDLRCSTTPRLSAGWPLGSQIYPSNWQREFSFI